MPQSPTLDDILDLFIGDGDPPSRERLYDFVARYPQYHDDLVAFAAAHAEQAALPEPEPLSAETEAAIASRTLSLVANLLYERDAGAGAQPAAPAVADPPPAGNLKDAADAAGLSLAAVASACRLDLSLVSKLNLRRIVADSIPADLFARLGEVLHAVPDQMRACTTGPPRLAAGRAYLASSKPEAAPPQTFADAVRTSSLSPDDKAFWLDQVA